MNIQYIKVGSVPEIIRLLPNSSEQADSYSYPFTLSETVHGENRKQKYQ